MKRKINILWTGGLDSTYRILELSMQPVTIQPYYLASVNPSTQYELNAISELTEIILNRQETKATLLPLVVVSIAQIKPNESISVAWEKLHKISSLGSQYDWIARFANQYQLTLELGIEKDPCESTIVRCLSLCGGSEEIVEEGLPYVKSTCDNDDARLVFQNMRFPVPLFNMTKQDEISQYKKWNAEDVLQKIWFCYRPVNEKPCGLCDPCKTYIEVGLGKMIPLRRLRLYYFRKKYRNVFECVRKIKHFCKGLTKK